MSKLKKIASIAVPLAASFIPGIGPLGMAAAGALGGAVGGGGLKGALMGGLTSGLGAGIMGSAPGTTGLGLIDDANSGLYNLMSGPRSAVSGLTSAMGLGGNASMGGGAGMGSTPSGLTQAAGRTTFLPEGFSLSKAGQLTDPFAGYNGGSALAQMANAGSNSGSVLSNIPVVGSVLDKGLSWAKENPVTAALTASTLYSGYNSAKERQAQTRSERRKAEQVNLQNLQDWKDTIATPPLERETEDYASDWKTYGYGPEHEFYKNNRVTFAKGGAVRSPLSSLRDRAAKLNPPRKTGHVKGKTRGMDDKVEAMLSDGEFVFPADVVSHLGDGNTDAGAKILENIVSNIRKKKTGKTAQPKPLEA